LLAGLRKKTTQLILTKFGENVAHEPRNWRKTPLELGGNPDNLTLELGLGYGYSYGEVSHTSRHGYVLSTFV